MKQSMWVTQAHYHTFDLQKGAVRLAGNENYENQAFRIGHKVYGFQFHPEVTIEGFRRWQKSNANCFERPGVQDLKHQNRAMYEYDATQADWFYGFMDTLFGSAK